MSAAVPANVPGAMRTRRTNYVQINRSVMSALSGKGAVLEVYLWLSDYADPHYGEGAYPSRPTLAKHIGKSVDTVDRAIATLTELGLVKVFRRYRDGDGNTSFVRNDTYKDQTSNGYLVAFDPGELSGEVADENEVEAVLEDFRNEGESLPEEGGRISAARTQTEGGGAASVRPGGPHQCGPNNNYLINNSLPDVASYVQDAGASESTDEKQGGENQSSTSGADAPKHAGDDATYQLALSIFNGWIASRGASFDKDTCNGFGRHIIDALDDGVEERAIVSALRLWDESGDSFSPGRLPSLIAKVQAGAKSADESAQLARLQREQSKKALEEQRERNARTRQERKRGKGLQSALAAREMNSLDDALRKPEEPAAGGTESDEQPQTASDPQDGKQNPL